MMGVENDLRTRSKAQSSMERQTVIKGRTLPISSPFRDLRLPLPSELGAVPLEPRVTSLSTKVTGEGAYVRSISVHRLSTRNSKPVIIELLTFLHLSLSEDFQLEKFYQEHRSYWFATVDTCYVWPAPGPTFDVNEWVSSRTALLKLAYTFTPVGLDFCTPLWRDNVTRDSRIVNIPPSRDGCGSTELVTCRFHCPLQTVKSGTTSTYAISISNP